MTARILVVEDEPHLADIISDNLRLEGWEVLTAADGERALELWRRVDLVLLDIMMPKISGFEVCETIRREGGRLPILFLTAKDSSADVIRGLELGGDDYMTKPFHLRELLLRVKSILRRQEWAAASSVPDQLEFGGNRIYFKTYEALCRHGKIRLNAKECHILRLLAEREGEVVSREEIIAKVWGEGASPSQRTVDNFIVRLRHWFEPEGEEPVHFRTVRGVGYQFFREPPARTGSEPKQGGT
ncbi:MAG: response regulator transcription factor [Planctomycetota bacterium]